MSGQFSFPVVGTSLHEQADTFGAGRSGGRSHKGMDIFADSGAPVVAVRGGTVVKAGDSGGLGGIRAWVRDDDGYYHYYAHLSSLSVTEGQRVEAGTRLGAVGNTGNARSTPAHLHYSVNPQGHTAEDGSLNPYDYLRSNGAVAAATHEYTGDWKDTVTAEAQGQVAEISPDAQFVESRRASSDTMASIMQTISDLSRKTTGGQELNVSAMFGDVFESDDVDTEAVPEDEVA